MCRQQLNPPWSRRARQAGLSLIEMMVGIAIGLIVVAGASLMMTSQVTQNSRVLQETQIQQDLRAAADLMLRDIRRAGFSSTAANGVWAPGASVPVTNIYAPLSNVADGSNRLLYAYARISGNGGSDVPAGNESFGFVLDTDTGVLSALNGTAFELDPATNTFSVPAGSTANWQPLTDPATVNVTSFTVAIVTQPLALGMFNETASNCAPGAPNCPCLLVRRVDISITGQATRDPAVQRTINVSARLRNDQIVPSCEAPV